MKNIAQSILDKLVAQYPDLGYHLGEQSVTIFYCRHFSGIVSLEHSAGEFKDWVTYYYDMGKHYSDMGLTLNCSYG